MAQKLKQSSQRKVHRNHASRMVKKAPIVHSTGQISTLCQQPKSWNSNTDGSTRRAAEAGFHIGQRTGPGGGLGGTGAMTQQAPRRYFGFVFRPRRGRSSGASSSSATPRILWSRGYPIWLFRCKYAAASKFPSFGSGGEPPLGGGFSVSGGSISSATAGARWRCNKRACHQHSVHDMENATNSLLNISHSKFRFQSPSRLSSAINRPPNEEKPSQISTHSGRYHPAWRQRLT